MPRGNVLRKEATVEYQKPSRYPFAKAPEAGVSQFRNKKSATSRLDELIKLIPDPELRNLVSQEVVKLKTTKKFGLVFEEHHPEIVQLPGLPIKAGVNAVKRGSKNDEIYKVIAAENGSKFRIMRVPDGQEEIVSAKELVVIKKFGEPIYPTLIPLDRVTRTQNKPYHSIINADNFHALQLLLYCYEGQVDVIYIDPPYNTGARDWKYNNNYVDENDQYRHSKWLSMMKKRLLLAKRLLKSDGVLIVTIDDYEAASLRILLDELFRDKEKATVVIKYNPAGTARNGFSRCHEYAYYILNEKQEIEKRSAPPDIRDQNLRRHGSGAKRQDSPTMFYPIYVDKKTLRVIGGGPQPPDDFHPEAQTIEKPHYYEIWPLDDKNKEKRWYYGRDRVQTNGKNELGCKWVKGRLHVYFHTDNHEEQKYQSVWIGSEFDAGAHGGRMVFNITGKEFPFPKSLYAVRDCLNAVVRNRKDAIILDFFAGSGTTFHATCLLNAEDGGNRRCLLVTNNEVSEKLVKQLNDKGIWPADPEFEKHGICESVTWPRCKYAVNGKRDDDTELLGAYLNGREMKEGFEENIEYFKLDFLDPDEVAYGEKFEAILPILWLMAGAQGERETSRGYAKWFIPKNSTYAVLIKEEYFAEFKRELKKCQDITHVFLVTDSEEAYREMIAELPGSPMTKMLYKSYLDNFRINTEKNL